MPSIFMALGAKASAEGREGCDFDRMKKVSALTTFLCNTYLVKTTYWV